MLRERQFFQLRPREEVALTFGDEVRRGEMTALSMEGFLVSGVTGRAGASCRFEAYIEETDLTGTGRLERQTETGDWVVQFSELRPKEKDRLLGIVTQVRKSDHIRICLEEPVAHRVTTGFERYRLAHAALPEVAKDGIDLETRFFGKKLSLPLLISCMTGGSKKAERINRVLAEAAQERNIALGLGSQRVLLEAEEALSTFTVRDLAPDVLLIGNIGAVQLNYGVGLDELKRLVSMVGADALAFHCNPLQEAIQPEGDTDFSNLFPKLETLLPDLGVPAILKEIGAGVSGPMAERAREVGLGAVDVAGAGGTSWARVEGERAQAPLVRHLGQLFADWGIPTAEALVACREACPHLPIIASGGMRNGIEATKAVALGADLVGIARPFLVAAQDGVEAVVRAIDRFEEELRIAMFCVGAAELADLRRVPIQRVE